MRTRSLNAANSGTIRLADDLSIARLGFGAMRLTGRGVWGPPADRNEAIAVLRRAVELGVTFIDTADSYGPYVSESLIAEALRPYPRGLVIATKGGFVRPGPDEWEIDCRPDRLADELDASLRRLKLDRIDLYQLHRIDPKVPEEDQFAFLHEAILSGKIRHVGLSEVSVDQIERARAYFKVASVQNRFNLVDREWEPVLDYCTFERIAFIPWYPLNAGNALEPNSALANLVSAIAERHGATPMQVSIAWLLGRSERMVPIPGTSRVAHLEQNIAAAELPLTRQEIDELSRLGADASKSE
jgi:aryl-alcohol dehydrogenase-like predicted oxidoreductase